MLKVTLTFLILLVFSAAAFDKSKTDDVVGQVSGTQVSHSTVTNKPYNR